MQRCTSVSIGKTTVHAKQKDVEATLEITVLPIKVEKIIIIANCEEIVERNGIVNFYATIVPRNATYPTVFWNTTDANIATIDEDGILTTHKIGNVTIIATTEDGCFSEYELTVKPSKSDLGTAGGLVSAAATAIGFAFKRKKKILH